jgi:hypothetical protein
MLKATLNRPGNLTPRLVSLLEIILSEDKKWEREEIIVNNQTYYTNHILQESVLSNT